MNRIHKAAALFILGLALTARADYQLPAGQPLFTRLGYNYGPSVIADGKTEKFWWCGFGLGPSGLTDTIQYRYRDRSTGQWSSTVQVMVPGTASWDSAFVCDPSVVTGNFINPEDGTAYVYAMYYTATDASQVNNRIGVAFSNDGITWVKYSQPVISPQQMNGSYGAGQASTYNFNGRSGLYIFYTDTTTGFGNRVFVRKTTDGVNFSAPVLISDENSAGLSLMSNADFAYDMVSRNFYAVRETIPSRLGDREVFQLMLARMPAADLLAGSGQWETLGFVNPALTGFYMNHNPGLLRNGFGQINISLPNVVVYFAGGTNDPATWNLASATWRPVPATLVLTRYYSAACGNGGMPERTVTVGYVAPWCSYRAEKVLGYLDMAPAAGEVALYGCMASQDQFLSRDSQCEGQLASGVMGYLPATATAGTTPLYRCINSASGDHFASLDAACEGQTTESVLGYIKLGP
ncbi:hypothetical protein [Paraburkholderia kururiensis]|uniref:hypothetical protein n=1 Tax=Paraburkholderia kururiensis TaxID=984307 RepID=UPI000AEC84D8|nr:hypothetical protein [Paraburkholderia kururiensis]